MISEDRSILLKKINKQFALFHQQLVHILSNNGDGVILCHKQLRELIYNFTALTPKPTIKQKAQISYRIRQNIKGYIYQVIKPKIELLIKRNDPQEFIQSFPDVWNNFERYVFAHQFVSDKLKQFFETFWKSSNAMDFKEGGEIVPVAIIAVNQIKNLFGIKKIFIDVFPAIFKTFLSKERQNFAVSRQRLRQTMEAIQSCFFDFEAMISLDNNKKPHIKKNPKGTLFNLRKARDGEYFQNNIMELILEQSKTYYLKFLNQILSRVNFTEGTYLMLKVIKEEQSRAQIYIHTKQNQRKYTANINSIIIETNLQQRIKNPSGLATYLREYKFGSIQYQTELQTFWKVYSKIINKALPFISEIYCNYLNEQAKSVQEKIAKSNQFIPELIRINQKNIKILTFFNGIFQLQNLRNQKIRAMFSNQIIKESKFKGMHTMGASNLAQFVNFKFKEYYEKGIQGKQNQILNLELLFKILNEKIHFTKEHQKFTSNRLIDQLDFSKDNKYSNIIKLQRGFIDEMEKQMGISQINQLSHYIKDIQKSYELTKTIKQKLGPKIHLMNQIIVKHNTYWPQVISFQIVSPNILLPIINEIQNYFLNSPFNIQFQLNKGVSLFRGQYNSKVPSQIFQLKNIYLIILLIIDEEQNKKILYGDLKNKIKSFGNTKEKGNFQLTKNIIELLHNGLLISKTKTISKEDQRVCSISQSDMFQINTEFNFEEQQLKNKMAPNMIKKLSVIRGGNLRLPQWLKSAIAKGSNQVIQGQIGYEKGRRTRVMAICVRVLKFANSNGNTCSFQQLFKEFNIPKHKQFKVTQKYLKQIIQQLINLQHCERLEDQKNVYKYRSENV